jgi:hypothetical protein
VTPAGLIWPANARAAVEAEKRARPCPDGESDCCGVAREPSLFAEPDVAQVSAEPAAAAVEVKADAAAAGSYSAPNCGCDASNCRGCRDPLPLFLLEAQIDRDLAAIWTAIIEPQIRSC